MKTILILCTFFVAAFTCGLFAAGKNPNNQPGDISIKDTREAYVFSARYDRSKTVSVERFINRNISPDHMGSSENDNIDAWTTLSDHTRFHIKESAGSLEILIRKTENTPASIARITNMCDAVKRLLTKK